MARQFMEDSEQFDLFKVDDYVREVVSFLGYLRSDIVLERFSSESPKDLLIAPKWGGLKNFEITDKIRKLLKDEDIFQACYRSLD